jgi:PleD family two-component response regulator
LKAYRILACASPEAERRLRKAVPADDLQMALTLSDAMSALLRHRWDAVIIGAMFDESRALELMQLLSSSEAIPRVPIVGIRGAKIPRFVSPAIFDVPMKSLGAVDVIDFAAIPDDAAGNVEIGARIRAAAR